MRDQPPATAAACAIVPESTGPMETPPVMQPDPNPLARLLQTVTAEIDQLARELDDLTWDAFVETEQRTVGQILDHIAWAWEAESAAFQAIADCAPGSGWTQPWLDAQNAEQARISATRSRRDIEQRIRESGQRAVAFVDSLTPDRLQRRGTHMPGEPERTVAGWIEACLIGHPQEHRPQIDRCRAASRIAPS